MNYKKIAIFLFCIILLLVFYVGCKIVQVDNNDYVPKVLQVSQVDTFDLRPYLVGIPDSSVSEKFPYRKYIKYGNYENILIIKRDLSVLDNLYPNNQMNNQRILSNTLTDSLFKEKKALFTQYAPDTLIYQMQWAQKFKSYGELEPDYAPLFNSIYDFWMNRIANSLGNYSNDAPKIKYDFKYRFLKAKCEEQRYPVSSKVTSAEKVFYNLIKGDKASLQHLVIASWNQATKTQVVIFILVALFTIFSLFITCKFIFQSFFKRNKNGKNSF